MNVVWVLPIAVLAAGSLAIVAALRQATAALDGVRDGLRSFADVGEAADALRADVEALHDHGRRLRR